jgi:hypothetical protein
MNFLLKTGLLIAVIAGGSVMLVRNVPSLQANVISVLNPQVKEQKLAQELTQYLSEINTSLVEITEDPAESAAAVAHVVSDNKHLITKSQEILKQIQDLQENHSGVISTVVGQVVQALTSNTTTSPVAVSSTSPVLSATLVPCSAR